MNVAEQIVTQLVDAGVHRIYGIVGDSLNPSLKKSIFSKSPSVILRVSDTKLTK